MKSEDLEKLARKFPISEATRRRNQDCAGRVCANDPKPIEGNTLERPAPREEACWYSPSQRFEIRFIVYSTRPADWDGYHVKELQDMVVKAGILYDDKSELLQGSVISRKAYSKEEVRTEVEIIPITG